MRYVSLLVFLLMPVVARADDSPSNVTTNMYGCSLSGVCLSFNVLQFPQLDPEGQPVFRALAGVVNVQCPNIQYCGINGFQSIVYDVNGDRLMSYQNGQIPRTFGSTIDPFSALVSFGWLETDGMNNAIGTPTNVSIVVTTTPEPLTLGLMSMGVLAVGLVRRRRRE